MFCLNWQVPVSLVEKLVIQQTLNLPSVKLVVVVLAIETHVTIATWMARIIASILNEVLLNDHKWSSQIRRACMFNIIEGQLYKCRLSTPLLKYVSTMRSNLRTKRGPWRNFWPTFRRKGIGKNDHKRGKFLVDGEERRTRFYKEVWKRQNTPYPHSPSSGILGVKIVVAIHLVGNRHPRAFPTNTRPSKITTSSNWLHS